jgi:DNA-binding LacI/PurR family transcriptional regulator
LAQSEKPQKMITLKTIADQLGVSVSTVGRALTDHPRIGSETKNRVFAAAKKLGYIANAPARLMRGGSSQVIGLLVPDIHSTFYSMVAQVFSECFQIEGFHLALSLTGDDRNVEMQHVRDFVGSRVAGIMMVPSAEPHRVTLGLLKNVPHVQVLRRIPALGDWFGLDDELAIHESAKHLIGLGHKRIAYIGDVMFNTGRTRYEGFRRAHREADRKVDKTIVELGSPNAEFGAAAVQRLMSSRPAPTALITSSVQVTLGAAEQLMLMGVSVPASLSVVGFGDGPWQKWWGPGLTTVRLPTEELAKSCALWFLHHLKAKANLPRVEPYLSISPTTMVLRSSTAPPHKGGR